MTEFHYTIQDPVGIHARPAGMLVKKAKEFAGTAITIEARGKAVNCLKLMGVMGMGVKKGDEVVIKLDGGDEAAACAGMKAFFEANL